MLTIMIAVTYYCDSTGDYKLKIFENDSYAKEWLIRETVDNGIIDMIYDVVNEKYCFKKTEIRECFEKYTLEQIIHVADRYNILFEYF